MHLQQDVITLGERRRSQYSFNHQQVYITVENLFVFSMYIMHVRVRRKFD